MLSRSICSFKEQVSFNFMAAVTICSDYGAPQNKVRHCFPCFPIYLPWSDGTGCHDLSFLNVKFFVLLFYFTILYWFCHTLTWILHECTCVPHPEPLSQLPTHPIPLGHPSAPAPSICIMNQTWTGDSFHILYFTCFNAILPYHPTLTLSHRVHKTVQYICVSFAVSHTGLLLPSF